MNDFQFTIAQALQQLLKREEKFVTILETELFSVEYYKPDKIDLQTPHKRDEIYIITSGSGKFIRDGETIQFTIGDLIFVLAEMPHRFIDFTNDFATWVIFFGTEKNDS